MTQSTEKTNPVNDMVSTNQSEEYQMQWNTDDMPKGSRRRSAKPHHHHHHHHHHRSSSRHSSSHRHRSSARSMPKSSDTVLTSETFERLLYQEPSDPSSVGTDEDVHTEMRSIQMDPEMKDEVNGHRNQGDTENQISGQEGEDHTVPETTGKHRKKNPDTTGKKKAGRWRKIVIATLSVIMILLIGGFAFVNGNLNKIQRESSDVVPTPDPDAVYSDDAGGNTDGNAVVYEDLDRKDRHGVGNLKVEPIVQDDVKNILLIGQDRRTGDGGRMRADSIIVATINLSTNEIELTSLMRDMYLPVPGYGYGMINSTYLNGGIALLDATIEQDFGITIDGNLQLDFTRFIGLMDMVGPIEIYLTEDEVSYLNEGHNWNLRSGTNSMTSEQVLAYCRTRAVGRSDWERTDRQRRVVTKIFNKLKRSDLSTLYAFANEAFPLFRTDMSNTEILQYVYTVISRHMSITESRRIPMEGTYTQEIREGSLHVLVPNLYANAQALQKYCYGYTNIEMKENRRKVEAQKSPSSLVLD